VFGQFIDQILYFLKFRENEIYSSVPKSCHEIHASLVLNLVKRLFSFYIYLVKLAILPLDTHFC